MAVCDFRQEARAGHDTFYAGCHVGAVYVRDKQENIIDCLAECLFVKTLVQ